MAGEQHRRSMGMARYVWIGLNSQMETRSYRNMWLVIISAKKMVVFWGCTIKFCQTPDSFLHTGKQNQTNAKDCSQQYYKLWNVHYHHSGTFIPSCLSCKSYNLEHWELNALYFSPYIPFIPVSIYQGMFEIQTDTCVDTNWSLLFSYFNRNLNLSTYVMKINSAVVQLWHAEGHDYANKSTATAVSCDSAKNHKWKLLFNKTTFYINHKKLSNTQLKCKFVQYVRLLLPIEIHIYMF